METDKKGRFTQGNKGKQKGAENKTTKRAKELVVELVEAGLPRALEMLESIKDPKEYLDALAKFMSYVVPKQVDTTINDTRITVIPPQKK